MSFEVVLFAIVAAIAIASALSVILHPHPVYSALSLVVTLFQIAALFVLLDAHAVAFLQIIVYAGAIMVLFLFVIMLLNLQREPHGPAPAWRRLVLFVGGVLGVELAGILLYAQPHAAGKMVADFGTFPGLGRSLFTRWALSFEITSVLLLAAVIGSVVLARKMGERS